MLRRMAARACAIAALAWAAPAAAQFPTMPGAIPHAGHGYCYQLSSTGVVLSQPSPCSTGGGAPPVRAVQVTGTASGNPISVAMPGAAQAGDFALMCIAGQFAPNATPPTGWTLIGTLIAQSTWSADCYQKTLTSADVATGSVSVTMQGSAATNSYFVDMAGGAALRTSAVFNGNSGSSTGGTATASGVVAGDTVVSFGSSIATTTITFSRGSVIANNNAHGTVYLATEAPTTGGSYAQTFTMGSAQVNVSYVLDVRCNAC